MAAKRVLLICGLLCAAVGLAALVFDLFMLASSGYDILDVPGVVDGVPIDWATGEQPPWALVPAYAYAMALLFLAAAVLYVRRHIRPPYHGRIWRGVE